jgi:D-xylose transport system permease protein
MATEQRNEPTAEEIMLGTPELVADSLGAYFKAWAKRVRGGESGALPVLGGLVLLIIIFQWQNSAFLSAGNLTNLLIQGAVFVLFGMAEVFVLLLGEIDLSVGYVGGIAAVIMGELVGYPHNLPWWLGIVAGLAAATVIGIVQGTLITRLGLPSFVVTLGGLLGFQGVMLWLIGNAGNANGGVIRVSQNHVIFDLVNGDLNVVAGWVALIMIVGVFAVATFTRDERRRAAGLAAPPLGLTILKIGVTAAAGVALVLICNANRGVLVPLRGIPWIVPIVLAIFVGWTFLLGRTRFGRYIYAIGGNAEAARRAGVNLARVRTAAFALASLTAGMAGVVYASQLGSISSDIDGGTYVLYAVAGAVIGGTSLFGGRGKMLHAVLGGLVIAAIYNGMGLLGMTADAQYMVTALVLVAAVTVDAVARRGRTTRS